mgnify:CR=1 FL=1
MEGRKRSHWFKAVLKCSWENLSWSSLIWLLDMGSYFCCLDSWFHLLSPVSYTHLTLPTSDLV